MIDRRTLLLVSGFSLRPTPGPAATSDDLWRALARGGHVALMRHATAPGTGDPPGFRLGDCATQRNLSEEGRREAARIGAAFRDRGVRVSRVLSSEWCRCVDTARAMAVGPVETAPRALNSFFENRAERAQSTAALRDLIAALPRGDGATVVLVTHQVNVTALTDVFPVSGEVVVLRLAGGGFDILGRLPPPSP